MLYQLNGRLDLATIHNTNDVDTTDWQALTCAAGMIDIVYPVPQDVLNRVCAIPSTRYILTNSMGELYVQDKLLQQQKQNEHRRAFDRNPAID